jgi:MOSC domain-containing protein YiiM
MNFHNELATKIRKDPACGVALRTAIFDFIEGKRIRANTRLFQTPSSVLCSRSGMKPLQRCVVLAVPTSNRVSLPIVPDILENWNVKLISLNVGRPKLMSYQGETINTGIFKKPVSGPIQLRTLNLDGDRQADLSVHGGPYKAVYAYPSEHYPFWRQQLDEMGDEWGMFGENFTTTGLSEDELHIGDRLQVGSSILMVRQPRMPCYKLAAKFGRDDMIALFLDSGRSGFYFSVEQEGVVTPGDSFEVLSRENDGITIAEMNRLFTRERYNRDLLQKALSTTALPEAWRDYFDRRLKAATNQTSI